MSCSSLRMKDQFQPPLEESDKVRPVVLCILSRVLVTVDMVLGWMIGFIASSELQAVQRCRYSAHFPVHRYARTRVLSLHLSYPGNGFITVSLSLQLTLEVFLAQSNFFLDISSQSPSTVISRTRTNSLQTTILYSFVHRPVF
jgi:hypothetical protein